MKNSSINQCSIIDLPKINSDNGSITAINGDIEVPFVINRIYYLYDIPSGEERGGHAHKELLQLIVAASGSFDIVLKDGMGEKTFTLNRPDKGLLLMPGIWRELNNFSSGSICLVLASAEYAESDYIREYSNFIKYKNEK